MKVPARRWGGSEPRDEALEVMGDMLAGSPGVGLAQLLGRRLESAPSPAGQRLDGSRRPWSLEAAGARLVSVHASDLRTELT